MKFLKNIFSKSKKEEDVKETGNYRCPQCGKDTEITTYTKYKQLVKCSHCGRVMVICHGKTIGYK